jgi:hypothetical protein
MEAVSQGANGSRRHKWHWKLAQENLLGYPISKKTHHKNKGGKRGRWWNGSRCQS